MKKRQYRIVRLEGSDAYHIQYRDFDPIGDDGNGSYSTPKYHYEKDGRRCDFYSQETAQFAINILKRMARPFTGEWQ